MKTSDKGLAEIAGHEGIVLSLYKDSVGVWTIGIGHTKSAGDPDPAAIRQALSVAEVMAIFRKDIARFEARVNDAVKVPLKQHEFDALVSFDFNTGGIYRARLTKRLNAGDKEGAAKAFMGWLKPPEIKGRRTAEMELFRTGRYGDGYAAMYRADASGRLRWAGGERIDVLVAMDAAYGAPEHPPDNQTTYPPPQPNRSLWALLAAFFRRLFS